MNTNKWIMVVFVGIVTVVALTIIATGLASAPVCGPGLV